MCHIVPFLFLAREANEFVRRCLCMLVTSEGSRCFRALLSVAILKYVYVV